MKKFYIFLFISLYAHCFAQQGKKVDSLTVLINTSQNQIQKGNLLIKRSKLQTVSAVNESYNDATLALEIAKAEKNKASQIQAYNQLAAVFFVKENFQKAIEYNERALMLSEQEDDNLGKISAYLSMSRNQKSLGNLKEAISSAENAKVIATSAKLMQELANINNVLGVAYRNNSEFQRSLDVLNEGISQTQNRRLIAVLKMNKANTLTELMRLDEAIENHLECLAIHEEFNDTRGKQQVYNNLGSLLKIAKQYDKSIYYFHKSLKIVKANNAKTAIALAYDNLATMYDLVNKHDSIIWYRKNAIILFESIKDDKNTARSYHNLGIYQLAQDKLEDAEKNLLIALQKRIQINSPIDIASTQTNLGILYDKRKQFDKAEKNLNEAKILLKNIPSDQKEELLHAFSNHFKLKGHFEKALKIKEEQLYLKDSLLHKSEIINVINKERDFVVKNQNNKLNKLKSLEKNVYKSKFIYGILIYIVALLALYSFVRWKKWDYSKKQLVIAEENHINALVELETVKKKSVIEYIILKNKSKVVLFDLFYIRSDDHYLELTKKNTKETIRGSLKDIAEQLPPNFYRCHKSYIVNTNFIKNTTAKGIIMQNNYVIPMSKSYKK